MVRASKSDARAMKNGALDARQYRHCVFLMGGSRSTERAKRLSVIPKSSASFKMACLGERTVVFDLSDPSSSHKTCRKSERSQEKENMKNSYFELTRFLHLCKSATFEDMPTHPSSPPRARKWASKVVRARRRRVLLVLLLMVVSSGRNTDGSKGGVAMDDDVALKQNQPISSAQWVKVAANSPWSSPTSWAKARALSNAGSSIGKSSLKEFS